MLNAEVKEFMNRAPSIWTLSSVSKDHLPHAIPALFHTVLEDDTLVMAQVFMQDTIENIANNPKVCVTSFQTGEGKPVGYRVEGTAKYVTEGPAVDLMRGIVEGRGLKFGNGVVLITPERAINVSPGPNCHKVME